MITRQRFRLGIWLCLYAGTLVSTEYPAQAQVSASPLDLRSVPTLPVEVTTIPVRGQDPWSLVEEVEGDLLACTLGVRCFRIDTRVSPAEPILLGPKGAYPSTGGLLGMSSAQGFASLWVSVNQGTDQGLHRWDLKTNQEVAKIPLNGIVFVGDGSVWVYDRFLLYRVDPKTNAVIAKISVDTKESDLALCNNGIPCIIPNIGSIWVLHDKGILSRIDPETNQPVAEILLDQRHRWRDSGLAAGDGAIWILESAKQGKYSEYSEGALIRVDTNTNQVVARISVGYSPRSVAVGGGFVWVSTYYTNAAGHFVLKIDPRINQVLGKIFLHGSQPLLNSGKDSLLAWGAELKFRWFGRGARTFIWKIPY